MQWVARKIATAILKKDADYHRRERNQKKPYGEVTRAFEQYWQNNPRDASGQALSEQKGQSHGCGEHRRCRVIHDIAADSDASGWKAKTIAAVQLDSHKKGKGNTIICYFISGRKLSADEVLQATGKYWLDRKSAAPGSYVAFDEDRCRAAGKGFAAENPVVTRQVTLNILRWDTSVKAGIRNKRKNCGWRKDYMMKVPCLINI